MYWPFFSLFSANVLVSASSIIIGRAKHGHHPSILIPRREERSGRRRQQRGGREGRGGRIFRPGANQEGGGRMKKVRDVRPSRLRLTHIIDLGCIFVKELSSFGSHPRNSQSTPQSTMWFINLHRPWSSESFLCTKDMMGAVDHSFTRKNSSPSHGREFLFEPIQQQGIVKGKKAFKKISKQNFTDTQHDLKWWYHPFTKNNS